MLMTCSGVGPHCDSRLLLRMAQVRFPVVGTGVISRKECMHGGVEHVCVHACSGAEPHGDRPLST